MADLNVLFKEHGLEGIVPYAFGLQGKGYTFLKNKLLAGTPFWIILSDETNVPFYFSTKGKVYFSIYSSQELAARKCDALSVRELYCTPVCLDMDSALTARVMKRYRDMGINYLLVNDSVWVSMGDLAPAATYDGLLTPETPLRNAQLNAALYATMQYIHTDIPCDPLIAYFWNLFKSAHFLCPVIPNDDLQPSQALDASNSTPHLLNVENMGDVLAVFTDPEFVALYAEQNGIERRNWSAAFTPTYLDMKEYIQMESLSGLLLNFGYGDFIMTQDTFDEMERIMLNQQANR